MIFMLLLLIVLGLGGWLVLAGRMEELSDRLEVLERESLAKTASEPALVPEVMREVARPVPAPAVSGAPPVSVPVAVPVPAFLPEPEPELLVESKPAADWEALLGGNILNKIGALVLVVGLALFLSYSWAHTTPAVRTISAGVVSATLLAAGVVLERREAYTMFARGLMGAGWAGLYATTYAAWAVDAARIIANPYLGSILLLAVAAGMIGHSLRYRSQAVTGVAFFCAFAALEVSSSSQFAVLSTLPLAVALLFLADRFGWYEMALAGAAAVWTVTGTRGDAGSSLTAVTALLLVNWALFECFDVLRLRREGKALAAEMLMPLNGLAFVGLTWAAWLAREPQSMWKMATLLACVFLGSAALRLLTRQDSRWEVPGIAAAAFGAMAIGGRASQNWTSPMLAIEAELVYLAGMRLRSRVLRWVAGLGFAVSAAQFVLTVPVKDWSPATLVQAGLYYANLAMGGSAAFGWSAAALVSWLLVHHAPQGFASVALLGYSGVLFEVGRRLDWPHLRKQACAVAGIGFVLTTAQVGPVAWLAPAIAAAFFYAAALRTTRVGLPVFAGVASAAAAYEVCLALWHVVPAGYQGMAFVLAGGVLLEAGLRRLPEEMVSAALGTQVAAIFWLFAEHGRGLTGAATTDVWVSFLVAGVAALITAVRCELVRDAASVVGAGLLMIGSARVLPQAFVAPAWVGLAAMFLEVGIRRTAGVTLRLIAVGIGVAAAVQSAVAVGPETLIVIAALFGGAWRLREDEAVRIVPSWAGTVLMLVWVHRELPEPSHAAGWAVFGLTLLVAGQRWQAALAGVCALAGALFGSQPLVWTGVVVAAFYAAQFVEREQRVRTGLSAAATAVLSVLIWNQVSGQLLTVALGAEGVVLLGAGFPLRERVFRLQGLALLLGCIGKLFLYDLRNLETLYRILSFITLGLILLGVSWFYARFRERLRRTFL